MFDERFAPSESGQYEVSDTIPTAPRMPGKIEHALDENVQAINREIGEIQNRINLEEADIREKDEKRQELLGLESVALAKVLETEIVEQRKKVAEMRDRISSLSKYLLAYVKPPKSPYESEERAA